MCARRITIGVDFCLKTLRHGENKDNISLQLWDIAGHERFGAMTRVYYRFAIAAVVCFDISRPSTLDNVKKWRDDINDKVVLPDGSPIPMLLLANKCDLPDISIDREKMDRFARENGFIGWFSTSAKDNTGIDESFEFLVDRVVSVTKKLRSSGTPVLAQDNGGNAANANNTGIRVLVDGDHGGASAESRRGARRAPARREQIGGNQYRNREQFQLEQRSGCCG